MSVELVQRSLVTIPKDVKALLNKSSSRMSAARAVSWLKRAAESGNADAQCVLAECYAEGFGVKQDFVQEVCWLRQSAKQSHPLGSYNLGLLYMYGGEAVRKNAKIAERLFTVAAAGNVTDAFYCLGRLSSRKARKNGWTHAVRFYSEGSRRGDADAAYELGVIYASRVLGKPDFKKAFRYFLVAAQEGIPEAQFNVAIHYDLGQGVRKDKKEAVRWYRRAAIKGDALAQCNLGIAYIEGEGVTENRRLGLKWLRRAEAAGDKLAKRVRAELENACGI